MARVREGEVEVMGMKNYGGSSGAEMPEDTEIKIQSELQWDSKTVNI